MLKEVDNLVIQNLKAPLFDRDVNLFCVKFKDLNSKKWMRVFFEDGNLAHIFYNKKFDELRYSFSLFFYDQFKIVEQYKKTR